ncbi:MAG: histone deacetylase family protein [Actinomycetota bacterium]|nr:histone deacetylase family protein [Actinomycetota bacterium]
MTPLQMPVVWTERHRGHAPDGGYWLGIRLPGDEEPERGDTLRDQLLAAGATLVDAPDLGVAPVLAVHEAAFVDCLRRAHAQWVADGHLTDPGQPQVVPYIFAMPGFAARARPDRPPATIRAEIGLYATDTLTLIGEGTFAAACAAVHASAHAAALVAGGLPAAYAAVRPPGHHAGPAFFGGSCYFNNAAAAAQHLRDSGVPRVAIVDIDAHQGNGTQEIFWARGDVFYGSVHVDPAAGWYPHFAGHADETGEAGGAGATLNLPLPPGTGDGPWLAAVQSLMQAVSAHGAQALVVSLGVDAAAGDPESPLQVSSDGFRAAGRLLAGPRLPTVFVQEGGYDLPHLGPLVLQVLRGFEGSHD